MDLLVLLFLLLVLWKDRGIRKADGPRAQWQMPKRIRRSTPYAARLGRREAHKKEN